MKKYVIPLLLLGSALIGFFVGGVVVQNSWNKEKLKQEQILNSFKDEIRTLEYKHRVKENQLIELMSESKLRYEKDISSINNDYNNRLLKYEERVSKYESESNSGSECSALAKHTARLDKALEQGRPLVREYQEAIRFQEQQLKYCSQIIKNDRELLK